MSESNKKPKWLRRLENESWQAELIVSGAAIFGSVQLTGLLDRLANWALTFFAPDSYVYLYFLFMYLFFVAVALVMAFVIHFVLRAIWIGLVGLNSIYPNGINVKGKVYSEYYYNKIAEEYNFKAYDIKSLDNLCSGIFASISYWSMAMLGISFVILILLTVKYLLGLVFDIKLANIIVLSLASVFAIFSFIPSILNLKPFKNNPQLQPIHYKTSKILLYITQGPFRKFSNYIGTTLMSYGGMGKTMLPAIVIMFVAGFFLVRSKAILLFDKDSLHQKYARTDKVHPEVYDDQLDAYNARLLSATIESKHSNKRSLQVFVPIFDNEDPVYEALCGEYEENEDLEQDENRRLARHFYLDCYQSYHRFYLNDNLIELELLKYEHPNKGEFGVLTHLSTSTCKDGKNLLKIEKIKNSSGDIYREMVIPFWYSED